MYLQIICPDEVNIPGHGFVSDEVNIPGYGYVSDEVNIPGHGFVPDKVNIPGLMDFFIFNFKSKIPVEVNSSNY